jgi:hypothetical protein
MSSHSELVSCFKHGRRGLQLRVRNSCRFAIEGIAVSLTLSEGVKVALRCWLTILREWVVTRV